MHSTGFVHCCKALQPFVGTKMNITNWSFDDFTFLPHTRTLEVITCLLPWKKCIDHPLNIYHIKFFPHIMLQNQLLSFSLTLSLELKLPTKYTNTSNVWHSKPKTKKNYIMPKLLATHSTCFCLFLTLHPHPSFQHNNPYITFIL